ncbi:probable membrane-associated kinase regulator 1 [Salvia miltiorrhiza]|uniref:probable membrane-associated kinase regulator 1 n=1 Tax=Salvia miltiorrhiza TaxID=226208 RepID=UPI0025AC9612|nr:probable membrane-associated kinase regulator 1 [Salvia miltiorrhiza]
MGRRHRSKSHTLPSSPTSSSSSSSSDFEFTISLSPHKSSRPADELFYKGQILPLHLSPRLSMVQSLLFSPSSSSSSATASRDSTASSDLLLDSDSSRPSSAADDDLIKRPPADLLSRKPSKYFSLAKFSSKAAAVKRASSTARGVLRKYFNKVKPLYEKLSHKQQQQQQTMPPPPSPPLPPPPPRSSEISQSFSGNLRYPRRRSSISSCPSSMTSSPRRGESGSGLGRGGSGSYNVGGSSMAELQSAIQGAIAHCKNSMMKSNAALTVSNDI